MNAISRIRKSEKDEEKLSEKLSDFYNKHKDTLMETYQLDESSAKIHCSEFMAEAEKGNIKLAERANKLFRIGVESYGQNKFIFNEIEE